MVWAVVAQRLSRSRQVTDNGVIMETDDEKISARIKMIDETEVTQSAQVQSWQLRFRFPAAHVCILLCFPAGPLLASVCDLRTAGGTDVPESDSKQLAYRFWLENLPVKRLEL